MLKHHCWRFIHVATCWWWIHQLNLIRSTWVLLVILIPVEGIRVYLVFHTLSLLLGTFQYVMFLVCIQPCIHQMLRCNENFFTKKKMSSYMEAEKLKSFFCNEPITSHQMTTGLISLLLPHPTRGPLDSLQCLLVNSNHFYFYFIGNVHSCGPLNWSHGQLVQDFSG